MNIYFVRHGQSVGNLKNTLQTPDVPLSEDGKKQAKAIATRLKNIKIDVIYASPFTRAKQTAKIISKELNLPIEYWEELRERKRPSEIVGLAYDDPRTIEINNIILQNHAAVDWKYSDEESFNDLLKRAINVEKHLFNHHKDQDVLCVSHSGIMKMIVLSMVLGDKLTPEVFWQFFNHSWNANTGITHVKYTDKYGWTLQSWNDTTHL
jgi:broad specificity phosphatase PhoE